MLLHQGSLWCVEQTGNVSIFERMGFEVTQRIESDILILASGNPATEVQMTMDVKGFDGHSDYYSQ